MNNVTEQIYVAASGLDFQMWHKADKPWSFKRKVIVRVVDAVASAREAVADLEEA